LKVLSGTRWKFLAKPSLGLTSRKNAQQLCNRTLATRMNLNANLSFTLMGTKKSLNAMRICRMRVCLIDRPTFSSSTDPTTFRNGKTLQLIVRVIVTKRMMEAGMSVIAKKNSTKTVEKICGSATGAPHQCNQHARIQTIIYTVKSLAKPYISLNRMKAKMNA
jgi:hypothetical protein